MIELYSGTPGSGKSLHLAQTVRAALTVQPVIGTFHINEKRLFKKTRYHYTYINIFNLTPDFLIQFAKDHLDRKNKNPEGSFLVVIDEAQRIFNARSWQENKDRMQWITFFAEHRHLGFDVILVSQNDRMLDRQIRALIEYEHIHRKITNFGIIGKFFSIFLGAFTVKKMWYPMKERIDGYFIRPDKRLYDFYDSFEDFSKSETGVSTLSTGVSVEDLEIYREKLAKIPCVVSAPT